MEEMKELKSVLRSLVVSSPSQVDVRTLLRDYRDMVGAPVPLAKYGYRDPLLFLKERCNDCFLFQGPSSNPVLTLIVPETLKHIDQFVQKQKTSSSAVKFKGKRRSVPEERVVKSQHNLITQTFQKNENNSLSLSQVQDCSNGIKNVTNNIAPKSKQVQNEKVQTLVNKSMANIRLRQKNTESENRQENIKLKPTEDNENTGSYDPFQNFLKRRMPLSNSSQFTHIEETPIIHDKVSCKDGSDSGRQTSSSSSTTKANKLQQLSKDIKDIVAEYPDGVWCTDLMRLYSERYGCELNYSRFGYTSILSLVTVLEDTLSVWQPLDSQDWLLRLRGAPGGAVGAPGGCGPARAAPGAAPGPRRHLLAAAMPAPAVDPEDALPGIDFEADVFPADCVSFMESIPGRGAGRGLEAGRGAMLPVVVGEVYSPSHFWLLQLGAHHQAMEDIMDQMTHYYTHGEGRSRRLSLGAVRVGHYCSSVYEGDWHRSLIVRVIDSDTVKVRHVDYGTVETVRAGALRPLRREWAALPAAARRARLAAVRPPAAGRRWPHAACAHFLRLVRDTRLVANVVAVDKEEDILEVLLINTSTEEDVCLSTSLVRSGHADTRHDSALQAAECYLYPRFEALENGHTPNYGDIHNYLRDGIALDCVDDYRRHVPSCLPPPSPPPLPSPPPPPSLPSPTPLCLPSPPPPSPPSSPLPSSSYSPSPDSASTPPASAPPSPERGPSPANSEPASLTSPNPPPPATAPDDAEPTPPPTKRDPVQPDMIPQQGPAHRMATPCPGVGFPPPVMFSPYPVYPPGPLPPPPAPAPGLRPGEVTLSVSECEIFKLLSSVAPAAAHWYMSDAISRAMRSPPAPAAPPAPRPSTLNPNAAEFRTPAGPPPLRAPLPPGMRPPPGFNFPP